MVEKKTKTPAHKKYRWFMSPEVAPTPFPNPKSFFQNKSSFPNFPRHMKYPLCALGVIITFRVALCVYIGWLAAAN